VERFPEPVWEALELALALRVPLALWVQRTAALQVKALPD
jgi:hypothetical protein